MGHEHVYGRRARHFSASGTEYFLNLIANGMSSQNAEPPARPPFQTGVPGWLSFDNKYKGGGVLEAAVQAHLQVRPLPPYLSFQVWGSWVFFRVARVCRTNVKQA